MKKLRYLFLIILTVASLKGFSQKADSSSVKLFAKIVGTWQVENVYDAGKNITLTVKDSAFAKTIHFKLDAKYTMSRGKVRLDSGSYNTNETSSTIYLQSATAKDDLKEWTVIIKGKDHLILVSKQQAAKKVKYELIRQGI